MNAINHDAFAQGTAEGLPLADPARPAFRYNIGKAWHHFRRLIADKENTEEVFYIFEALPWKDLPRAAERFLSTPAGQALRAKEPFLPAVLDDHAALRRMPQGSLAHAYCDFMEAEGLTAEGLVEEFAKFEANRGQYNDQINWYFNRLRDTHDLLHILTGYGRDALGEQCVLVFTYSQQPAPAHLFIAYAGGWELKKQVKAPAPVFRAVREGQRLGKACPRLIEMPVTDLLPMQLDDVRKALGITPTRHYHAAHEAWRAAGVDPYDMLGKQAA